jgi:hypothetical protein
MNYGLKGDETMRMTEFFHLDCNSIIPECAYQCDKCIEEILFVFKGMEGISEVSSGKRGEITGIVVQYDSEKTTKAHLMNAFSKLPSFYKGRFVPKVLDS